MGCPDLPISSIRPFSSAEVESASGRAATLRCEICATRVLCGSGDTGATGADGVAGGVAAAGASAATSGDADGAAGTCADAAGAAGSLWAGAGAVPATDAADEGATVGAEVEGVFALGAGLHAHKPSADNRTSRLSSMTAPCGCCEQSACAFAGAAFSWKATPRERRGWLATFA